MLANTLQYSIHATGRFATPRLPGMVELTPLLIPVVCPAILLDVLVQAGRQAHGGRAGKRSGVLRGQPLLVLKTGL